MIKKGMLVSVGVGVGVEYALYSSIKNNNPNFIGFIVTTQSRDTLYRPLTEEKEKGILDIVLDYEIILADNPEDLNDMFKVCEKSLHILLEKGFNRSEIVVDITSGTKVMSAALAALAVLYKVYSIIYVGGRRGLNGIVIKETEKLHLVKPIRILMVQDFNRIKDYFTIFQFEAAKSIVDKLLKDSNFLDEEERNKIKEVKEIIEGYINWERFNHKEALKNFEKVTDSQSILIQRKYLQELRNENRCVAAKISNLVKESHFVKQVSTKYLILDLFHNAKRRAQEGKYDDAIGRLYRCLEMIPQYVLLMKHNLISSDIEIEKLKSKITDDLFEQLYLQKKKNQKVLGGLKVVFEILSALDKEDPVTVQYLNNREKLDKCLGFRNKSILAHGVTPTDIDNYIEMEEVVKGFVQSLIPDAGDKMKELESLFKSEVLHLGS